MFNFLGLPLELRTMIYNYSLLTSVKINPSGIKFGRWPRSDFTKFTTSMNKPTISLLGVNKQIRDEACPVFYSKNLLLLEWDPEDPSSLSLWAEHKAHFRHIMIAFDSHRLTSGLGCCMSPYFSSFNRNTREDRELIAAHNRLVDDLLSRFEGKLSLVKDLKLESLILDMANCWCPQTCCRLAKRVCTKVLMKYYPPKGLQTSPYSQSLTHQGNIEVKFVGIDTGEKAFIRNMGFLDENLTRKTVRTKKTPVGIFPDG